MNTAFEPAPHLVVTDRVIRRMLGPIDDELVAAIQDTGATRDEVLQAWAWLDEEDYMGTMLQKPMNHRTRAVYDLLREDAETLDGYLN